MGRKKKKSPLTGIERIAAERARQISEEGWTAEHDRGHPDGDLSLAAICYAAAAVNIPVFLKRIWNNGIGFHDPWPWSAEWDKRPRRRSGEENLKKPSKQQALRMLEKAGALIAAEIDRITGTNTMCIHCDAPITNSETANVCDTCAEEEDDG